MPWLQGRPEPTMSQSSCKEALRGVFRCVLQSRKTCAQKAGIFFSHIWREPRSIKYLEEPKFIPHAERGCAGQKGYKLLPGGYLTDWPTAKPNSRHTLQLQKHQIGKKDKLSTMVNQQNSPKPLADLLDRIKTQNSGFFFSKSLATE